MKRRLIIDAQVFHTPAWHRGMGKYSIELVASIAELNLDEKQWDTIEIVLSSTMPLEDGIIDLIKKKIKRAKIVYLDLMKDEITNAQAIMARNRKVLNEHVAHLLDKNSKEKIDFLILSPMQGGICSVFPTDEKVHKALIFYDLIPFMFHEIYFRNPISKMESLTKTTELLKADTYLAISKTVANDLAIYLGVDPSRIKNIDGGPINHATKSSKYNIDGPFILMPTGNELRKNNRMGILGFSEFNEKFNNRYSLVVTSSFDPDQVAELSKLNKKVIFTGNISGDELNYLYETCEALLFPSKYEGLGLPVLEAAEKNKPVACSDIMVFREISKTAFYFFNPDLGTSIATALETALNGGVNTAEYKKLLARYTWKNSAEAALAALTRPDVEVINKREKLAIFAQNPESGGIVARNIQRLHSELSRFYDTTYFQEGICDGDSPRPNMLPYVTTSHNISEDIPISLSSDDMVLYHLENSANSSKALFTALARPGIVVLHSINLSRAWVGMVEKYGLITNRRYKAEKLLNSKYKAEGASMLTTLIAQQKGIIVFSEEAKNIVETILKQLQSTATVTVASFPVSILVYDEPIPDRQNTLGTVNLLPDSHGAAVFMEATHPEFAKEQIYEGIESVPYDKVDHTSTVHIPSDRYFEYVISRVAICFSSNDESSLYALEAARYGAASVKIETDTTSIATDLATTVNVEGVGGLNKFMDSFALNTNKEKAYKNVRNDISEHNRFRSFAETIHNLTNSFAREENVNE